MRPARSLSHRFLWSAFAGLALLYAGCWQEVHYHPDDQPASDAATDQSSAENEPGGAQPQADGAPEGAVSSGSGADTR